MAKVVIIGNSAAGFSASRVFAERHAGIEVTVISQEDCFPYKKNLLPQYVASLLKEDELSLSDKGFYQQHGVGFSKGVKVARVDTKKRVVVLKDNTKIIYDWLVIASGCRIEIPDIPGRTKEGVYALDNITDARQTKEQLAFARTVCLIGEAGFSSDLAQMLSSRGVEVKIISKDKPQGFMDSEKIEWIDKLEVTEFIGEGSQLQALKLSSGKIIATPLAIFIGGAMPNSDFLKDSDIKTSEQGYIIVDDNMRTNRDNVFACGSVCRRSGALEGVKSWEIAVAEGSSVAECILKVIERGKGLCQQML